MNGCLAQSFLVNVSIAFKILCWYSFNVQQRHRIAIVRQRPAHLLKYNKNFDKCFTRVYFNSMVDSCNYLMIYCITRRRTHNPVQYLTLVVINTLWKIWNVYISILITSLNWNGVGSWNTSSWNTQSRGKARHHRRRYSRNYPRILLFRHPYG